MQYTWDFTGETRVKWHPDRGPLRRQRGWWTEKYNSTIAQWIPVRRLSHEEAIMVENGHKVPVQGVSYMEDY